MRALLINSAGTSGFLIDFSSPPGVGTALYRFNPMSNTLGYADWKIETINGNPGGIVFGSKENMVFAFFDSDDELNA